ncbi:MAG: TolC family protein [Verrucomicrobiota bacterium]
MAIIPAGAELGTYNDFLEHAKENNPGVQAAYNRWQAELSKADVVKALPDPRLTYSYFIESVETRIGPQEQKAGISQQFPWFGKLDARQKAQLARADSAYEQYRSTLLKLAYDVRRAYAECWLLHRETELAKQHIQLLENIERVAESRVRAGASASEVIKTQLERARLEERLQTLDEKRVPINSKLNAALNRDAKFPIPPIHNLESRSIDAGALRSLETNPGLLALRHEQAGAEADIRAARKNGLPDITLGIEWIGIGDASTPVNDSGKDAWMAGIGVSLPLWRGKYKADAGRATYTREAFDFARQQKANELRAELESALADYREAIRKIALYRDTILPQTGKLLELNETDYRSGKAGYLDLIDTQRSILRYQLELARAQADSQIHLAKIEMLIGKELNHEE